MAVFSNSFFSCKQCYLSTLCCNDHIRLKISVCIICMLLKMYLLMTKDQTVTFRVTLQHVELTATYCSTCPSSSDKPKGAGTMNKGLFITYFDMRWCTNVCYRKSPVHERHENSSQLWFSLSTDTDRPVLVCYQLQESRPSRTQDNRRDSSMSSDINTLSCSLLLCCKQIVDYFDTVLTLLYL